MKAKHRSLAVVACLMVLLLAAYEPLRHNGFVDYDDDTYVLDNPQVTGGFSWSGVRWAFTTFHAGNWHPLTWISHQADVTLFGLRPFGHHLSSLALHMTSTALLFLLLQALTGRTAPSALVGLLFGVHPLHVESVAWVSERKDVLAAFFWLLTIRAYVSWSRRSGLSRYLFALTFFALSLLAKPMAVTLPAVLLLIDYWPLGRLAIAAGGAPERAGRASFLQLLAEKIPFFLLAVISSAVTLLTQGRGSMFYPLPLAWRLGNALSAYIRYLSRSFWPIKLTAFYPHSDAMIHTWELLLAAALVAGASGAVAVMARKRPWLFVGWFWYLGTLVPVIGLVQVGSQAYADRYTYLPLIGFFGALAWEGSAAFRSRPRAAAAAAAAGLIALLALVPVTRRQVGYWEDSAAFFTHMLAATERNWIAYNGVGVALGRNGRFAEAASCFAEAVRVRPSFFMGWSNLGNALNELGRPEAVAAFEKAIRLKPDYAPAYYNLARHYLTAGDIASAKATRLRLESLDPSWAERLDRYIAPTKSNRPP